MKWIVIFCCYMGMASEPDGQMIISQEKVEAFGKTWDVLPLKGTYLENGSNGVHKAILVLRTYENNKEVIAHLVIQGQHITFTIVGVENAVMIQQPISNNTIYSGG